MKLIKKLVFVLLFLTLCGGMIGCDLVSNITNNGDGGKAKTAKLDINEQGLYYGGDVKVEVLESSVKVTDPSGKVLEYELFEESGKIYFLDNDKKEYCTFSDGEVSNSKGTFKKDKLANIESSKLGFYYGDNVTVEVSKSQVKVTDPSGKTLTYNLYDDGSIYFVEEGEKKYCSFGDGYVTNYHGMFVREGYTGKVYYLAELPKSNQGIYEGSGKIIEVYENSLSILDGKTTNYYIYNDENLFIFVGDEKVYLTFTSNTLSYDNGSYIKTFESTEKEFPYKELKDFLAVPEPLVFTASNARYLNGESTDSASGIRFFVVSMKLLDSSKANVDKVRNEIFKDLGDYVDGFGIELPEGYYLSINVQEDVGRFDFAYFYPNF